MNAAPYLAPDSPTVVLDTDLGHDLDDMLTLWAGTRLVRHLGVITTDETEDYQRAHLARKVLNSHGRPDVPVIAGRRLPGADQRFVMGGLVQPTWPACTDVLGYVSAICEKSTHPVIWVGMGPASNLADVLTARPDLCPQIRLTMMGGWLDRYRNPDRASHNPRMDPAAFDLVMRTAHKPRLVMSSHTNVDELAVTPTSDLYACVTRPNAPAELDLIAQNASRWFAYRARRAPQAVPSSWMNDPLTLAAALDVPVVEFVPETVRIEADARMNRDPGGYPIQVSAEVDYSGFLSWLTAALPLTAKHTCPHSKPRSTHTIDTTGKGMPFV
ncbi:nucleoside hydrolase [Nocardia iowensis]|uniref:Nucleoside hydrolase n=1 Tax=Nocardia iowensis TaxID=204891 RepID=A0ABX8RKM9_NOCIO|nr:nucleoside hydrolase [Nocardia iowensis]QXN88835.1 nucleoside hydrolase [Nocardia iowensis]